MSKIEDKQDWEDLYCQLSHSKVREINPEFYYDALALIRGAYTIDSDQWKITAMGYFIVGVPALMLCVRFFIFMLLKI
jgi:hypothetical protein